MKIELADKTYTPQRVFCVGRNYAAHIDELRNQMPDEPIIFSKPATSLVPPEQKDIPYPPNTSKLHYETEMVVLIGKTGKPRDEQEALDYVAGLAVGLDLTLRDVQDRLLPRGLPWDICKGFDNSAPLGYFVPHTPELDLKSIRFFGTVNGELRQRGDTALMIFPVTRLLIEIARYWQLLPGDLLFTGTPEGVGELQPGDSIEISGIHQQGCAWNIC